MPDPFPNELVEAAAVVCYSLAPEHDTSTYPHGYVPYDEARPSSRENARADALEVLTALYPLIEQRARLDERERLSSRVHENGWCPTCARDTDEAAMQRLAGKSLESLSRNDLIGLALRNLNAAMDAEPRADAAEQRVIDRLAGEAGEPPYEEWNPTRAVWLEAVACGVAAERARWEALLRDDRVRQRLNAFPLSGAWIGAPGEGRAEIVDAVLSTLTQLVALSSPAEPDTGEEPS